VQIIILPPPFGIDPAGSRKAVEEQQQVALIRFQMLQLTPGSRLSGVGVVGDAGQSRTELF
jgi:hypothetical protein